MGPSCPFETISISISILFDFAQEKTLQCVERTKKIRNFWTVLAIESQKAAENSQNKININYSRGFIMLQMLQTQLAFRFPALEINKSFFIDRNKRDGKS